MSTPPPTISQFLLQRVGAACDATGIWWNDSKGSTHLAPWRDVLARGKAPFLANLILVGLVGFNTWNVSHDLLARAVIVQIGIGAAWTFNVRSLAQGGWIERAGYIAGGCAGISAALWTARLLAGLAR